MSNDEIAVFELIEKAHWACAPYQPGPVVDQMIAQGLVAIWPSEIKPLPWLPHGGRIAGGPFITLTPYGAWIRQMELREHQRVFWTHSKTKDGHTIHERDIGEEPYWSSKNKPNPKRGPIVFSKTKMVEFIDLNLIPDPHPQSDYLLNEEGSPIIIQNQMIPIDKKLGKIF